MDEVTGRYGTKAGSDPQERFRRQREKVKKQQDLDDRLREPILHSPHGDDVQPAEYLFSTLWRKGEVALLFGAPAVGKSIFAVRLAEMLAGSADTRRGPRRSIS